MGDVNSYMYIGAIDPSYPSGSYYLWLVVHDPVTGSRANVTGGISCTIIDPQTGNPASTPLFLPYSTPAYPGAGGVYRADFNPTTGLGDQKRATIITEFVVNGKQRVLFQEYYLTRQEEYGEELMNIAPQIRVKTDNLSFDGSDNIYATRRASSTVAAESTSTDILTEVQSIQNNTNFVGIVPNPLVKPESGTKDYKFLARLYDTDGNPEDPDGNSMTIRADDSAGTQIFAAQPMTRAGVGQYEYVRSISDLTDEEQWVMHFEYDENTISFDQVRTTEVIVPTALGAELADSTQNKTVIREAVFDDPDILVGGTKTFRQIMREAWAMTIGKLVRTGDSYAYKDDDDTTTIFTHTVSDTGRDRS